MKLYVTRRREPPGAGFQARACNQDFLVPGSRLECSSPEALASSFSKLSKQTVRCARGQFEIVRGVVKLYVTRRREPPGAGFQAGPGTSRIWKVGSIRLLFPGGFIMARSRYRFGLEPYPYFMTQSVVGWLPVFAQPLFVNVVFDSWRFLQAQRGIRILAYVVMENHLHWIAAGDRLGDRVGESKSFIARSIVDLMKAGTSAGMLKDLERLKLNAKLDQRYQLWEEGSHPQQIDRDEVLWQKIEYIHNNPLRRGYVNDPTHWQYSSARNYAQLSSLIEVDTQWY